MPIPKAAVVIPVYTVQRWAQMKIKSNLVHFAGQSCPFNTVNTQYIFTLYYACWYARKKSSLTWFPRYIQSYSPFPHPPSPSQAHILGHRPIFICFLNNYQIAYSFSPMFFYVNNFACFKNNKLCLTCHSTTWWRQKKNTGKKSFLSSDCYKRELFRSLKFWTRNSYFELPFKTNISLISPRHEWPKRRLHPPAKKRVVVVLFWRLQACLLFDMPYLEFEFLW